MLKKIVPVVVALAISASALAAGKAVKQINGVVNINTATASELTMLPGIGKAKAEAIITHRQASPFKSPSELTKIKGIGEKMFSKMESHVTVDGPTTARVVKVPASDQPAATTAARQAPATAQVAR